MMGIRSSADVVGAASVRRAPTAVVMGPQGSGKTHLLRLVAASAADIGNSTLTVNLGRGGVSWRSPSNSGVSPHLSVEYIRQLTRDALLILDETPVRGADGSLDITDTQRDVLDAALAHRGSLVLAMQRPVFCARSVFRVLCLHRLERLPPDVWPMAFACNPSRHLSQDAVLGEAGDTETVWSASLSGVAHRLAERMYASMVGLT